MRSVSPATCPPSTPSTAERVGQELAGHMAHAAGFLERRSAGYSRTPAGVNRGRLECSVYSRLTRGMREWVRCGENLAAFGLAESANGEET